MSYAVDEYDLERSHELERRIDRDAEREPYRRHRKMVRRPSYFSGSIFRPVSYSDAGNAGEKRAA